MPGEPEPWACRGSNVVTCTATTTIAGSEPELLDLQVNIASSTAGTLINHVTVGGGGASGIASSADPITVSNAPVSFGVQDFEIWASNPDGTADIQAGSHPYELTTAFDLTTYQGNSEKEVGEEGSIPAGEGENIAVNLPPGIIGDPNAVAQCPRKLFVEESCPASTQVGIDRAFIGQLSYRFSVFNLVPPAGMPAQLAFELVGNNVFVDIGVRSGGDYGLTARVDHVPQREVNFNELTVWGVPSDPSHDPERCAAEFDQNGELGRKCGLHGANPVVETPFLTLPTACGTEPNGAIPSSSIEMNSWQDESRVSRLATPFTDNEGTPTGFSGCQHLAFSPTITAAPDTTHADTPAGLSVDVRVPQEGLLDGEGLSTADIQNTTVTLPEGLAINPGQAAGLQSCPEGRPDPAEGRYGDALTTAAEKAHEPAEEDNEAPSCPNASKVGTVTIKTPLLEGAAEKQLEGNVYVLPSNPPEIKLLVAASADGVNVKLVGVVHLNEQTGQLTTKFEGTPELPFTDFKLSFSGGAQAALATPTGCGSYGTNADFTPWSSPFSPDAPSESSFAISAGPGGGSCPSSPLPFSPSLTAGSTTDQAGGFTNFSLLLQRGDGQQRIASLQFKAPAGLTGELSKVPLCTNAQAESNTCPEASKIGHTVVESGPGPYPLVVPEPGQLPAPIYLTESYGGAQFGLSVVVPLHVGPFTLPTQRVRAKIEINPITTQLTITTNELPQILAGVPTDLREVDAVIERPEFMVNPTNCDPQEFSGTATGTPPPGVGGPGASSPISSHFGVGSCRSLKFEPKFSVSTSGKTSRSKGASLTAKVSYPNVPQGTDADIAKVKVELPRFLPSRLTTLQKACTSKQFEANPASCPSESKIGFAVVHTPLLPVPLEGPAIFVSHGGEAFPSLTLVLQGDGVTVDLVGATLIKNGVTSTTFKTVPDAPFSTFELTLPEGPYSALAANGNLCTLTKSALVKKKVTIKVHGRRRTVTRKVKMALASSLVMPNEFVGQNGAVIHRSTPIAVTGCAKAKPAKKTSKKPHKKK
ncbi:MAG TPA: hypothetical protein VGG98_01430 [Solirubrobacteraceae bacterium]